MCTVAITSVLGTPSSSATTNVVVQGTVVACNSGVVNVTVGCAGSASGGTATVTGGNWSVTIQSKCLCNAPVNVTAVCPDNPPCSATFTGPLPCNCCPRVTVTAPQIGPCDANGNRPVTFITSISVVQSGCAPVVVERDFGDNTTGAAQVISTAGTFTYTEVHTYAPGNYTSLLNVLSPSGCPPAPIAVSVPSCPPVACCPVLNAGVNVGNCDGSGNFTATFSLTVTVAAGCPSAVVQLDFGDGNLNAAQSFGAGTTTVSYPHTYNTNNAPYTASFNVIAPSGCPGATVTVSPPNTPECDCTTTALSWFCPLLFGIMTFGFGLALACVLLSTCSGLSAISNGLLTASAVFAALALLALILYLIFCNKCTQCGWFYLLLWRIFFGVGVIYAIFAACCGGLTAFLIGLGLIVLGILFLVLWANQCNKTLCEVLAEIILTLAVYILPAISLLLSNFALLSACLYVVFTIGSFAVTFLLIVTILNAIIVSYYLSNC